MRSRVHSRPIRRCSLSPASPPSRPSAMTASIAVVRLSCALAPISSAASARPGSAAIAASRRKGGEAFVRVEDPAFDKDGFAGPPAELLHRAQKAHPVQDLLLSAVLDRGQRPRPPARIVAFRKSAIKRAVGLDIGMEQVVFRGQK